MGKRLLWYGNRQTLIKSLQKELREMRSRASLARIRQGQIERELENLGVIVPTDLDPLAQRGGSCNGS